jgi:hypothetical protein
MLADPPLTSLDTFPILFAGAERAGVADAGAHLLIVL